MSKKTMLAETQLTPSHDTVTIELVESDDDAFVKVHDVVTVELVQDDDGMGMVQVTWPLRPTRIDPAGFRDTASAMVRLFSEAHVRLTRIRSRRHR
jgi:hypothetical protein